MNARKASLKALGLLFVVIAAVGVAQAASTGAAPGRPLGGALGKAGVAGAPTVLHVLDPSSQYVAGCFPAPPHGCGGPLILYPDFGGTFGLTVIGHDRRGFTVFAVSEIMLSAGPESNFVEVVGSGLYRRQFGPGAQQELLLFVTVNGEPSLFHSGLVPVPGDEHAIDIAVNMNDLQNYDILMRIVADPGS